MHDAKQIASEQTVTQPLAPGRCWFGVRPGKSESKDKQKFCTEQDVRVWWVWKGPEGGKVSSIRVKMWLCRKHWAKMRDNGYQLELIKGEQIK